MIVQKEASRQKANKIQRPTEAKHKNGDKSESESENESENNYDNESICISQSEQENKSGSESESENENENENLSSAQLQSENPIKTIDQLQTFLNTFQSENYYLDVVLALVCSSENDIKLVEEQIGKELDVITTESWFDDNESDGRETYIFIKDLNEKYFEIAKKLQIWMYNKKKGYSVPFDDANPKYFERFRDFHKHKMILYKLNTFFNLDVFLKSGIVSDVVIMHDFGSRNALKQNWADNRIGQILDPLRIGLNQNNSWPFSTIAFYFGCDNALTLSFISVYTSYLILLGVFAIGFSLYIIKAGDFDNETTPIFGIIIALWVSIVFEMWKRRESENVCVWRTENSDKNELPLLDFKGHTTSNSLTNEIMKIDTMNNDTRQNIMIVPITLIGFGLIAINFYVFTKLSIMIDDSDLGELWKNVIGILIGFVNGATNNFFEWAFEFFIEKALDWENHKYDSTKQSSYLMKMFVYQFVLNYINIFYYLFVVNNYPVFTLNYLSTVISNDVYYFIENNLLPYLSYAGKKKLLEDTFKATHKHQVDELKKAKWN